MYHLSSKNIIPKKRAEHQLQLIIYGFDRALKTGKIFQTQPFRLFQVMESSLLFSDQVLGLLVPVHSGHRCPSIDRALKTGKIFQTQPFRLFQVMESSLLFSDQVLGLLVPVHSGHRCPSIPGLSTLSSSRGLTSLFKIGRSLPQNRKNLSDTTLSSVSSHGVLSSLF